MGLDLGSARIGVAVSDENRRVALALGTVHTGAPKDLRSIAALVRENGVTTVVVGEPLLLSGEAGEAALHAREFADALRAVLDVPVELFDERFTTDLARQTAGTAPEDALAAAHLLSGWLERWSPATS
jgi:putative Holliday junction resolvase